MTRHPACLALAGLFFASMAMAAPSTMTIQGHLANGGTPTDGDHPTIFSLYDAPTGGILRWTETDTIHVASYLYSSVLGKNVPLPAAIFGQPLWLETAVDGTTLSPRIQLTAAPYSQWAQRSDTATVALNGPPTGGPWDTDGTNVWRVGGSVGVGTATPQATLDIASGADTELMFSGAGTADIFAPNEDLKMNAGLGWSLYFGADGIPNQLIIRHDQTIVNVDLNVHGNITAPNEDVQMNAGLGWSLRFGADGIPDQLIIRHNQTFVSGDMTVNGGLTVTGTKCRAVQTEHFGELKMNATESGHALFVDDGQTARLTNGRCRIDLASKFLATVTVDESHRLIVNVTFYGPHGDGWYVQRDQQGFTVIDPSGSNAEFSWTATARQKKYEDTYLEPVEVQTAGN